MENARGTEGPESSDKQSVMVCYARPEKVWSKTLQVRRSATVFEIVKQSGFFNEHVSVLPEKLIYGVYGKKVSHEDTVGPGDRIEIYRPLNFDPKESRRRRAAHRAAKNKHPAKK